MLLTAQDIERLSGRPRSTVRRWLRRWFGPGTRHVARTVPLADYCAATGQDPDDVLAALGQAPARAA